MNILRLHPENGGAAVTIDQPIVRVGRDASSDVHLGDASVSRQHAEIELRGDDWIIVDQNSANGIRIDGVRTQQALLLPGQQLHIGNLKFRVEIDRGNDGATLMLGRSPLLDEVADQTLMAVAPPSGVEPEPEEKRGRGGLLAMAIAGVIVISVGLVAIAYLKDRQAEGDARAAAATPRPFPTPLPTPSPVATPLPTPEPTRRPTGLLLISTDVDARVSIDGRVVADIQATGLRRFAVVPGEHLVRFEWEGTQTEVVARVRANEQTVVRRNGEGSETEAPPSPPAATPTPL